MGNYSWGSCFNKTTSVASVAAICSPVVGMGCRVSCCSGTPSVGEDKLFVPVDDGASVHHLDGKWRDRETAGEFDSILQMPFTEVILSRSYKESPITEKLGFKTLFEDDVKRKLKDSEISLSDHVNVEENPTDESDSALTISTVDLQSVDTDSSSTNLEVNSEDKDMSLPDNEVEKEADCRLEKSVGDEEEKNEKKPELFTAEPVTTGSLLDTPQGIYNQTKEVEPGTKKTKAQKRKLRRKRMFEALKKKLPTPRKNDINHYIYSVFFRIFYILTLLLNGRLNTL